MSNRKFLQRRCHFWSWYRERTKIKVLTFSFRIAAKTNIENQIQRVISGKEQFEPNDFIWEFEWHERTHTRYINYWNTTSYWFSLLEILVDATSMFKYMAHIRAHASACVFLRASAEDTLKPNARYVAWAKSVYKTTIATFKAHSVNVKSSRSHICDNKIKYAVVNGKRSTLSVCKMPSSVSCNTIATNSFLFPFPFMKELRWWIKMVRV